MDFTDPEDGFFVSVQDDEALNDFDDIDAVDAIDAEPFSRAKVKAELGAKSINGEAVASALAELPTTDALLRSGTIEAQTLIQKFGERDEMVNAIGHDLLQTLKIIGIELRLRPERALEPILASLPPEARAEAVDNLRAMLDRVTAQ